MNKSIGELKQGYMIERGFWQADSVSANIVRLLQGFPSICYSPCV